VTPERLTFLRGLLLRLAPELSEGPLYVLSQPEHLPAPSLVNAYVVQGDAAMKAHLEATGQWFGMGPAVVYVDQTMSHEEQVKVLLHEGSHILPFASAPDVEVSEISVQSALAGYDTWARDLEPQNVDLPPWYPSHGKNFTRICLHLWWRAAMLGHVIPFDGLCAGIRYGLNEPYCYWRSLGNEAVVMKHKSFSEILQTDPPSLFTEFWRADVRAWMRNNAEAVAKLEAVA
jgi:hypothetical protein